MSYNVTQQDISVLGQPSKKLYVKLELLNTDFLPIDTLDGEILSGNISIDANTDIRRTANLKFIVNKKYIVNENSRIWFNKYVKIYLGIETLRGHEILYYPKGIYVFKEDNYQYDTANNMMTVKCVDLMNVFTTTKLYGTENYTIPAGSNIRDAMVSVVSQLGGIKKYLIGDVGSEYGDKINAVSDVQYNVVPYDLKFTSNDTLFTVIAKLRDLYAGWETFFDDDTFVCQKIPTGDNEPIVLDNETIEKKNLIIGEQFNNSFDAVKNITQVFGNEINVDRYTENCTNTGTQYNATFDNLSGLEDGTIYAVKLNVPNSENPTLKINSFDVYPITDSSGGQLIAGTINGYCAFKFQDQKFLYLGQYQVVGLAVHTSNTPDREMNNYYKTKFNTENISYIINSSSPFTVEKIGERIDVKSGDTYSSIYSQDLALDRARLENWKTTRFEDKITLDMQLIPWLDVNKLITYKSYETNELAHYMIKSISINLLDGKMSVTAIKYYPLYPDSTAPSAAMDKINNLGIQITSDIADGYLTLEVKDDGRLYSEKTENAGTNYNFILTDSGHLNMTYN